MQNQNESKPLQIKLRANERVLIAGKTGSGKTYAARQLLSGVRRLVVIDSKATLTDWNLHEPQAWDWYQFGKGKPGRFRILAPIVDNPELWYETLFERLYYIGDLTLYIDEAYQVTSSSQPQKWLRALYTRGRELGIGVWASTQRPASIPVILISEAETILTFRLNWPDDRKRLAGVVGPEVVNPVKEKYAFWVYRAEDDRATLVKLG
jgi:DNA helicase HerA-like ATPase